MSDFSFLRRVLAVDSLTTIAAGLGLILAAESLAPLTGYTAGFVRGVGLVMLPLAAFFGWLATWKVPPAPLIWAVIAGNLLWMIESAVLIGQFGPALTAFGLALTVGQAAWVGLMGALEYAGLRRGQRAAA